MQQTCSLFGLDLERPPPLPPARAYTVDGNRKLGYPQERLMRLNYPGTLAGERAADGWVGQGENVLFCLFVDLSAFVRPM